MADSLSGSARELETLENIKLNLNTMI